MRLRNLPTQEMEQILRAAGNKLVAGVDEAGRGAWAGPVVAAAVILPELKGNFGINDSKAMTPLQREQVYEEILKLAVAVGVGIVETDAIDEVGVGQATYQAMYRAVSALPTQPEFILVDGFRVSFTQAPSAGVVKGDCKCLAVAAASIVAKVTRDKLMTELHQKYPRFGFAIHKGYGTLLHRERIKTHGVCHIHRKSFTPIREGLTKNILQLAIEESVTTV